MDTVTVIIDRDAVEDAQDSTCPKCQVSVEGIENADLARQLASAIALLAIDFGMHAPLQGLDGITVTTRYKNALQTLDRGIKTDHVLQPTEDMGAGVAMAPLVVRNGQAMTHIIIDAEIAACVLHTDKNIRRQGMYMITHELAHAAQLTQLNYDLPDFILDTENRFLKTDLERAYYTIVSGCWNEYYACRQSAFVSEQSVIDSDIVFARALHQIPIDIEEAKSAYRFHADTASFFLHTQTRCGEIMRYASYVFGNIDGRVPIIDQENAPEMHQALQTEWRVPLQSLQAGLHHLWDTLGTWKGDTSVFRPLYSAADKFLERFGIFLTEIDQGTFYIDVPFYPLSGQ